MDARWRLLAPLAALVLFPPNSMGQQTACSQDDLAGRLQAMDMYCDASQATCGASCAGVLLSTFDECALDSETQARWQEVRGACADTASDGHGGTEEVWLRGDCRAEGRYACTHGGTCVLRGQHHRRRSQQDHASGLCPPDLLPLRSNAVTAACCSGPGDDCSSGIPATCSPECRATLDYSGLLLTTLDYSGLLKATQGY